MAKPFRWEVNVQTGERAQIELTDAETAEALAGKAAEDVEDAARYAAEARVAARRALLDRLVDKFQDDPSIIDRIR